MPVLHKLLQDKNNLNQVRVIHFYKCGTLGSGRFPFKKALVATMRRVFALSLILDGPGDQSCSAELVRNGLF